jgi:DNA polymerase I-like protein with 3'-5' exonuclease and polymerase domains
MPVISAHELWSDQGNLMIYNGLDCCTTFEIEQNTRDLCEKNQTKLIENFSHMMQAPAMEMQLRGFKVNSIARDKLIIETEEKLKQVQNILNQLVAPFGLSSLNPNSGLQLKTLFYKHLNIKPISSWSKGEVSQAMDRKILEKLESHFYARPFVLCVLLIRELLKTLIVLNTEIDPDFRWRCSYNIAGTVTGRWASSKSGIGTGSNFQNISEDLRKVFISDKGKKLCGIDLEQADSNHVGLFCGLILGDWSYLNACQSGDLHTTVTRMVYPNWDWNGDKSHDRKLADRIFYRHFTYRDANKRLGHGTNFLGQPDNMAKQTKLPAPLVREFYERYMTAFPCIPRMHKYIISKLQTERKLTNSYGRVREFFDRTSNTETHRAGIAYMFQSDTGDCLSLGLHRVHRYMGTKIELLSQLHDAFYFQYDENKEQELIPQALNLMQIKRLFYLPDGTVKEFIVRGEPQVGYNWGHRWKRDAEGNLIDHNPRGLDKFKRT